MSLEACSILNKDGPLYLPILVLIHTCAACAIGPMYELVTQLIFPFKIIFCNLIEFSMPKTTQNIEYLLHLEPKNYKSLSLSFNYQGLSKNIKSVPKFPCNF
jgi:hypothetical protein